MAGEQARAQMQVEEPLLCRAKHWGECTEEERCEWLREQVRNAQSRVAELERQVFHLVRHQHGEGGHGDDPRFGAAPSNSWPGRNLGPIRPERCLLLMNGAARGPRMPQVESDGPGAPAGGQTFKGAGKAAASGASRRPRAVRPRSRP